MAGYTPAFSSIYDGTLCGKWPTAVLWASLLPLIDVKGEIDLSYEAIAARTGWPMDLLRLGIQELMLPDPGSRSPAEEGRRLVLIDPARPWGWKAVNVRKYRDKASGAAQVEDGRNAAKVKRYKAKHRGTPPDTAGHRGTPSNTHSDSDSDSKEEEKSARAALVLHASLPEEAWTEWLAHRREKRLSMSPRALNKQLKLLAEYPTAMQREIIDTSINAGWEGLFRPKGKDAKPNGKVEWT